MKKLLFFFLTTFVFSGLVLSNDQDLPVLLDDYGDETLTQNPDADGSITTSGYSQQFDCDNQQPIHSVQAQRNAWLAAWATCSPNCVELLSETTLTETLANGKCRVKYTLIYRCVPCDEEPEPPEEG